MAKIQRALLSVFDKTGLIPFAQVLAAAGVEIISTGGTAKALRDQGLIVSDLSAYTEFPEMMDGRVKTLHPKIHGGLLYIRGNKEHEAAAQKHGIQPIDLVVVNLYPFAQTVARPGVTLAEAIENIDIGGPSMLRSAAKNHDSVTVVTDPANYAEVADQIVANGQTTPWNCAVAWRAAVSPGRRLTTGRLRPFLRRHSAAPKRSRSIAGHAATQSAAVLQSLRYGENPHQRAALYGRFGDYFQQQHGRELSYNTIIDLTAAAALAAEFAKSTPTLAILKHTNPCGVGQGKTLREAWEKAFATDRQAPFGGIIVVNRPLDLACAEAITEIFSEVIVAPDFAPDALELLRRKKNLRLMKVLKWPGRRLDRNCATWGRNPFCSRSATTKY